MPETKIQSVLAACGPDSCADAVKQAGLLAGAIGARLKIVDTLPEPPAYRRIAIPNYAELAALAREKKRKQLQVLARRWRAEGLEVEEEIFRGALEAELIRDVRERGHGLVVVPAERTESGSRAGQTAMHLLRNCPCPVWIVRPRRSRRRMRILAAVATQPGNPANAELNAGILHLAETLCRAFAGELHILHAWRAFGESLFAHSPFCQGEDEQARSYFEEIRRQHAAELQALLARCDASLPARCVHLERGEAQAVIPGFCKTHKIDLLVMGSAGRRGMSALLVGNTAETVANAVECSLLAVTREMDAAA